MTDHNNSLTRVASPGGGRVSRADAVWWRQLLVRAGAPLRRLVCPRCSAIGTLYRDPDNAGYFFVEWTDGRECWGDTMLRLDDWQRSTFGCGYCGRRR